MPKLGLALSGGGFRATLYHLGVIRYLRDAGALQNVTDIASVSGGSILAAHLVLNWDRYNGDDDSFAKAAKEVVRFVQFDLRNHIVRRMPLQMPLRLLAKLPLLEGRNFTPNALLQRYYKKHLYGDRCLYELPEQPMLHMLATSVRTGALSVFNRDGLFIQQRGNDDNQSFQHIQGQLASLPLVVGASSAFPGLFPPVEVSAADLGVRDGQFTTEFFTDGGVYDNLGLRAFSWLRQREVSFDQILVSDAGKPFQILSDASLGFIGQSMRRTEKAAFGWAPGRLLWPQPTRPPSPRNLPRPR
jgi:predicted acylesterase/phospholipase RssA